MFQILFQELFGQALERDDIIWLTFKDLGQRDCISVGHLLGVRPKGPLEIEPNTKETETASGVVWLGNQLYSQIWLGR
jgi:hypothetical protein